jgi:DNA-binding MarR family transcriptional regulator
MRRSKPSCDERHTVWPLFIRTYSTLVEILEAELVHEKDLPLAWFEVLVHLQDRSDGRMQMNELADTVLLSKSGLTRLVDRMETAGLVRRTTSDSDRRIIYAELTARGRAQFSEAAPIAFAGVRRHFTANLTREELGALESALEKILRAAAPGDPHRGPRI